MTAATQKASDTAEVSRYTKLRRACDVFALVHSADGELCVFRDHLPRHLSSAVNMAAKVLGSDTPLRVVAREQHGAMDATTLMKALGECGQLARYPDLAFVAAVESLARHQHKVNAIRNLWPSDPSGTTTELNKLLQDLHYDGHRQQIIAQSLAQQQQAQANWASIQSSIDGVFATHSQLFGCKVDLLHQDAVPKDKTRAMALYDQLTQGQTFMHAEVGQVQSWQRAFHATLSASIPWQQKLVASVYVTSYSHITGPYTTAILLFDGAEISPDKMRCLLLTSWNTTTDGQGYCFHWPSAKCQWTGPIKSDNDIKRQKLLHGLECVALAEMYVRPRCLNNQPTFVIGSASELNKD